MAGELRNEPWHAFGLGKAPTVAGKLLLCMSLRLTLLICRSTLASKSYSEKFVHKLVDISHALQAETLI